MPSGTERRRHLDDLLLRSATGDVQAFSEFHRTTRSAVYHVVLGVVRNPSHAAEVTQECYLLYWQDSHRFDSARGSAHGWMSTIARRRAIDWVRSSQSAVDRDVVWAKHEPRYADGADEHFFEQADAELDRRTDDRVRRAVQTLAGGQREAIELAFYGGRTHAQVASALGIPLGTAKSRVRDGLSRLRTALGQADLPSAV